MKYFIIASVLFFISCNGYGQTKKLIEVEGHPLPIRVTTSPVDSSKIYWKKQIYWENKMNRELERLNRTGHAKDISRALVRYQDSAIHYKIILDNLKK